MTLRYSDTNQHDALYKIARQFKGGIEALAQRMGKTAAVLYNKLRPGIHTHYVSFEEVSEIVELCQEVGVKDALLPIHALCARHGLVAFPVPAIGDISDDDLTQCVYNSMKELGDVAASVSDSLAGDGKINAKELDRIEKEFQEALAALAEWRARIRTRSEKDRA